MAGTRLNYLKNIGVDVWTLRENVVDVLQVQGSAPAEGAISAAAPNIAADIPERDKVNESGFQADATPDTAIGTPALRAIAAQLRSAEGKPAPVSVANQASSVPASKSPTTQTAEGVSSTGPDVDKTKSANNRSPEFLFCFMDYVPEQGDGATFVFCLPYESQSLSREIRQFGDDVARGLFGGPLRPDVGELRWPMVRSAHIAQTELEAKAVVIDRVSRCQKNLIVFGDIVQHYVIGGAAGTTLEKEGVEKEEAGGKAMHETGPDKVGGKRIYRALGHEAYCSEGLAVGKTVGNSKLELWRLLVEVRKVL